MSDSLPKVDSRTASRRWWFRFSLRSLLLLITLFAVWLGVMTHRAREQARAVRVIEKRGGRVVYDYELNSQSGRIPDARPPGPQWLRWLIGRHFGTSVVEVDLAAGGLAVTDEDLAVLRSLPRVRVLNLARTGITDAGLEHLSNLNDLSYLCLVRCRIDGSGLRHVRHLPIDGLNLNWTQLKDANLEHVGAMTRLGSLTMQDTPITGRGLVYLGGLTILFELHIHNTVVSDEGLAHLEGLSRLTTLHLTNTNVTKEGVEKLKRALPSLSVSSGQYAH